MRDGSKSLTSDATWPADDPRLAEILDLIAVETSVPRERLAPDATIASLEIASLDLVQAVFAIESRFGVEIPVIGERDDAEFTTVGDLVKQALAAVERGPA